MIYKKLNMLAKIRLMLWKNFSVCLNNRVDLILILLTPFAFGIAIIICRCRVNVEHKPYETFKMDPDNYAWQKLFKIIAERQEYFTSMMPDFTHSVYVPQRILGFAPKFPKRLEAMLETEFMPKMKIDFDPQLEVKMFDDCDELRSEMMHEHFFAGICVTDETLLDDIVTDVDFSYSILFPSELRIFEVNMLGEDWDTRINTKSRLSPRRIIHNKFPDKYLREGFYRIQAAFTNLIIKYTLEASKKTEELKYYNELNKRQQKLLRFPILPHIEDDLLEKYSPTMTTLIIFSYIVPSVIFVNIIVLDKECGIRAYLRIMDISLYQQLIAWLAVGLLIMLYNTVIIIIFLKIRWCNDHAIMTQSSFLCLLFVFCGYSFTNTCFCLMISSLSASNRSTTTFFAFFWSTFYIQFLDTSHHNVLYESNFVDLYVFFNCTMCNCIKMILDMECFDAGLDWKHIAIPRLLGTIGILYLNGFFFFLLARYLEDFNPGMYGKPYDICKRLKRMCCCDGTGTARQTELKLINMTRSLVAQQNSLPSSIMSDGESQRLSYHSNRQRRSKRSTTSDQVVTEESIVVIDLINLALKFENSSPILEHLTLRVYNHEILVLMGPNGCGKTVLARMLAGIQKPTTGTIIVNDNDVVKDRSKAVEGIGMALGKSLLLDHLTFSQQIRLHSRVKGMTAHRTQEEINHFINTMQLDDYRHTLTANLSIGLKHQLALMCAFTGTSNVIILDDIDLAFDGAVHNILVDMLSREKQTRTIFMTTNSPAIATKLADRIALLAGGKLICVGGLNHLKEIYGNNFYLVCFKRLNRCDTARLTEIMQKHFRVIAGISDYHTFVTYKLRRIDADKVAGALNELERRLEELGLASLTIRETSIEDIFYTVSEIRPKTGEFFRPSMVIRDYIDRETQPKKDIRMIEALGRYEDLLTGCALCGQRLHGVLLKQYYVLRYNQRFIKRIIIFIYICMVGWIVFLMIDIRDFQPLPIRECNLSMYHNTLTLISSSRKHTLNDETVAYYVRDLYTEDTKHEFIDASGQSIPEYLLHHTDIQKLRLMNELIAGYKATKNYIFIMYSSFLLHTVPTSLSMLQNALWRTAMKNMLPTVRVSIEPLPSVTGDALLVARSQTFAFFNTIMCIAFGLILFYIFLWRPESRERIQTHHTRHLIGNAGLEFWIGSAIIHFLHALFTVPIVVGTLFLVHEACRQPEFLFYMSIILYLLCMYLTLLRFLIALLIKSERINLLSISLVALSFLVAMYFCNRFDIETHHEEGNLFFFGFLPMYVLYEGMYHVMHVSFEKKLCENKDVYQASLYINECAGFPNCCKTDNIWDRANSDIFSLLCINLVLLLLLLFFENTNFIIARMHLRALCPKLRKLFSRDAIMQSSDSDSPLVVRQNLRHDVNASERERVKALVENRDHTKDVPVLMDDVTKSFSKKKVILRNQCLMVENNECFALLGPNGCGKTTILNMIVGDMQPQSGNVYSYGVSSQFPSDHHHKNIGFYIPQKKILRTYRIREILEIAALIRGVRMNKYKEICKNLAKMLGIFKDYEKKIKVCSKGTIQRVGIALTIIGSPKLCIFDGSSVDIDPAGKLTFYNMLCELKQMGSTTIITSLTVAECEMLCDRVAILLNGEFQVIGTPEEIYNSYMRGYCLSIKLKKFILKTNRLSRPKLQKISEKAFSNLTEFIESNFENVLLKGDPGQRLVFFIPFETSSMGDIFSVILKNIDVFHMDEVSLTHNSLDFIVEDMVYGDISTERKMAQAYIRY